MRFTHTLTLFALVCAGLMSRPAVSQDQTEATRLAARDAAAFAELTRLKHQERSMRDIRLTYELKFSAYDVDGGGYTESDIAFGEVIRKAKKRSQLLRGWLQNDLNGNGEITREELRRVLTPHARQPLRTASGGFVLPTEEQVAQALEQLVAQTKLPDPDGDGVTTLGEMMHMAKVTVEAQFDERGYNRTTKLSSAFDRDRDGTISRSEYVDTVIEVAKRFDLDEDGFLNQGEAGALRSAVNEARQQEIRLQSKQRRQKLEMEAAQRKGQARSSTSSIASRAGPVPSSCSLPPLSKDSNLAVVSAFAASALSTAYLGDPRKIVGYGEIDIQPGAKPLYLVLRSAGSMIFRVTGDTDKLRRVVVFGARTGLAGVAKDKVLWLEDKDCGLQTTSFSTRNGIEAKRILGHAAGRRPDFYAHLSHFGLLRLPSGPHVPEPRFARAVVPDRNGPAAAIWARFEALRPGGLVHIRSKEVLAKKKVRPYKLLPQEAGLAQLVEQGGLALVDPGEHTARLPAAPGGGVVFHGVTFIGGGNDVLIDGDKVYAANGKGGYEGGRLPVFRVVAPLTLPPGLHGIHSAVFKLPEGIAKPEGELGAGRIESE